MSSSPSSRAPDKRESKSCPSCQSRNTIRTVERFGEQMYFCADCEHTWSVHKNAGAVKSKRR